MADEAERQDDEDLGYVPIENPNADIEEDRSAPWRNDNGTEYKVLAGKKAGVEGREYVAGFQLGTDDWPSYNRDFRYADAGRAYDAAYADNMRSMLADDRNYQRRGAELSVQQAVEIADATRQSIDTVNRGPDGAGAEGERDFDAAVEEIATQAPFNPVLRSRLANGEVKHPEAIRAVADARERLLEQFTPEQMEAHKYDAVLDQIDRPARRAEAERFLTRMENKAPGLDYAEVSARTLPVSESVEVAERSTGPDWRAERSAYVLLSRLEQPRMAYGERSYGEPVAREAEVAAGAAKVNSMDINAKPPGIGDFLPDDRPPSTSAIGAQARVADFIHNDKPIAISRIGENRQEANMSSVEQSAGEVILEGIDSMKDPVRQKAAMKIVGEISARHAMRKNEADRTTERGPRAEERQVEQSRDIER